MALESFYGGKQGVSPVIKDKFKYINTDDLAYQERLGETTNLTREEAIWLNDFFNTTNYVKDASITWDADKLKPFTMDECLKDLNYTDVWYGELCIIDTDNKMNPNNGKLYRRTLKQVDNKKARTEDTLYAEYVGQIVGPSGGIPKFDFGSLDAERKKAVGKMPTYDTESATDDDSLDTSNWDYVYPANSDGTITVQNPQGDEDKIAILSADTPGVGTSTANMQMVPGKVGTKYNDTIKYTWCNVQRKLNSENNDAWIYLGFEIPYTSYDTNGVEENYTYNGEVFIDNSSSEHPFYKNYTFHIPRGTRGIGPERVYTINPKETNSQPTPNPLYAFDAIQYDQSTDTYSIDTSKTKTVKTTDSYWVAMWSLYNPKTTTVETVYQYLGSYKDVREVSLEHDGTLTFTYSDGTTESLDNKIKWINNITIDTERIKNNADNNNYGKITITYNDDTSFEKILPLIKDNEFDPDTGLIEFTYAGSPESILSTTKPISYISKMKITDEAKIQYQLNTESGNTWHSIQDNSNPSKDFQIRDIQQIINDENNDNTFKIIYRDGTSNTVTVTTSGEISSGNSNIYISYIENSTRTVAPSEENAPYPRIYFEEEDTSGSARYTTENFSPWVSQ